MTGNYSKLAAR